MVPAWSFMVEDVDKTKDFSWDAVPFPKIPDVKGINLFNVVSVLQKHQSVLKNL